MSPGGRRLATESENKTIRLWNMDSEALTRCSASYPAGVIQLITFSPDCRVVATTYADQNMML